MMQAGPADTFYIIDLLWLSMITGHCLAAVEIFVFK